MRYRLLGKSGLRVSELCLGTATFGQDWGWGTDEAESKSLFELFATQGGNFIDTANFYTNGSSEKMVGKFIQSDRDHFVVSTKFTPSLGNDLVKAGNSRKNMMRCVDESLRRLNTDYIDLYWLHFWDFTTPLEEIMRGLDDLVSSGKVLYIGASDTHAWRIGAANMLAQLRGWTPFIGVQTQYSLAERSAERELMPMCKEMDIGIMVFNVLEGGILTGKYLGTNGSGPKKTPAGSKISERSQAIARKIVEIANDLELTPSQIALAAIRQKQTFGPLIPILGARSTAQLRDNLSCLNVILPEEYMRTIDEMTAIDLGVPAAMLNSQRALNMATGGQPTLLDNHRR